MVQARKKKLSDTIHSFNDFYRTEDRSKINFIDQQQKTFKVGGYTLIIDPRRFDFSQLDRRDIKFFEPNEPRDYPQILEIIAQLYGSKSESSDGQTKYIFEAKIQSQGNGTKEGLLVFNVRKANGVLQFINVERHYNYANSAWASLAPVYLGPLPVLPQRSIGAHTGSPQASEAGPEKELTDAIDSFNDYYKTNDRSIINFINAKESTLRVGSYTLTIEPSHLDFSQLDRRDIKFFEPDKPRGYPQILEIIAQLYGSKNESSDGQTKYSLEAKILGLNGSTEEGPLVFNVRKANGVLQFINVERPSSLLQASDTIPKKKLTDTIDSFNTYYKTKDRSKINSISAKERTFKVGSYTLTIEPPGFELSKLDRRDIKFFEPNELREYPQILEIIVQLYGKKSENNQGNITYEIIGQEDSSLEKFIMIFILNEHGEGRYELVKIEKISLSEIRERNASLSKKIPSIIESFNAMQLVGDGATLKDIILEDFSFNLIISDPANQLEITLWINRLFDENTLLKGSFKEIDYSYAVKIKSFSENYPTYVNDYYKKYKEYPPDHHIFTKLVDVIVQRYGIRTIDRQNNNFSKIYLNGKFQYLQDEILAGQFELSYFYEKPNQCAHRVFRVLVEDNPFYKRDYEK
ncbi:MAG: hypothetical protein K2X90_02595 [Candidatus Babeliaceae bacterium]|nr:hypothetical protein [Candidatus Babeliaceae bacterium]